MQRADASDSRQIGRLPRGCPDALLTTTKSLNRSRGIHKLSFALRCGSFDIYLPQIVRTPRFYFSNND